MQTRRTALGLLAAAPFALGCDAEDIVWTPIADADERVYGLWESEATGHVIRVSPAGVEAFHRLDDFWIQDGGVLPTIALFAHYGDALLLQHYDYRATPYLLQAPMVLTRSALTIPDFVPYSREALPTPAVFDLFCRSYERYYAFFAERGVDWAAARRAMTPRIVQQPDDDALFDIFSEMLAPLGDGHVNLTHGGRSFNAGRNALRERLKRIWRERGAPQTEQEFVSNWSRETRAAAFQALNDDTRRARANGAIEFGRIGASGYLRINRFSEFITDGAPRPEQVAALQAALAEAERAFGDAEHVIVDVAHNGGGNDAAAMVVARHFADRRRMVLEYRVRGMPDQPLHIEPAAAPYPRRVTLLTSEITASAAETFVLMLRAFAHVTHVGGKTRGILSSLLPKPLPNSFRATIAYQRVLDSAGALYEARGVPPAREIELFPDENLTGGYANVIRALAG
jgi:carboxyl-terminal processing protease